MTATEYAVQCPDGHVWDEDGGDREYAEVMLREDAAACGCEQQPHVVVQRTVGPWALGPPVDLTPAMPPGMSAVATGWTIFCDDCHLRFDGLGHSVAERGAVQHRCDVHGEPCAEHGGAS